MPEVNLDKEIMELLFRTVGAGKRAAEAETVNDFHFIGQIRCLDIVASAGSINQRELLDVMEIRPASLSELLIKLESSGLILRQEDENDRRSRVVSVTSKGVERLRRSREMRDKMFSLKMSVLSEQEKKQLYAILLKLYTAWSEQGGSPRQEHCLRRTRRRF